MRSRFRLPTTTIRAGSSIKFLFSSSLWVALFVLRTSAGRTKTLIDGFGNDCANVCDIIPNSFARVNKQFLILSCTMGLILPDCYGGIGETHHIDILDASVFTEQDHCREGLSQRHWSAMPYSFFEQNTLSLLD